MIKLFDRARRLSLILSFGAVFTPAAWAENIFLVNEVRGSLMAHSDDAPYQLVFEACIVEQISGVSLVGQSVELTDGQNKFDYITDGRGCIRWGEAHAILPHTLRYVQFARELRVRESPGLWERVFRSAEHSQIFKIPVLVDFANLAVADGRFKVVPKDDTDLKETLFFGQPI